MIKKFFLILISFAVLAAVWGLFIEPNIIAVENVSFDIENLPPEFENVKFVQLSDIHIKELGYREERVIELVKKIDPDYIFITGDIVDWSTNEYTGLGIFLEKLSQEDSKPVFAVLGNHDYRNKNFKELSRVLKEKNIKVLTNESTKIEKGDSFIYLLGVGDPHLGFDDFQKARAGAGQDAPEILLAHSPEIFRKVKGKGIDLVLTGHTHGCQVWLPFICDFVVPLNYDKQYKRGIFNEESTYMYVNRGIGNTLFSFRLNSLPEITVISLK